MGASANSSSSSKPAFCIDAPMAYSAARECVLGTDMGTIKIARQQPAGSAGRAAHQFR